ncbi:MAG: ECF transporter S component [Anaeroplasmataceae bacterium]
MKKHISVKNLVGLSILLALVILLQMLGGAFKIGIFQINLALLPITVGAIIFGPFYGGVLGLISGGVILLNGDAAAFLSYSVFGTILIVLLKGFLSGFVSGLAYKYISKKNKLVAAIVASILAPLVNTAVFAIGCFTVLRSAVINMSGESGWKATAFLFTTLISYNFIIEMLCSAIFSPIIARVSNIGIQTFDTKKTKKKESVDNDITN